MNMSPIEDRLMFSVSSGAVDGDSFERSVCEAQMREAAREIVMLKKEIKDLIFELNRSRQ